MPYSDSTFALTLLTEGALDPARRRELAGGLAARGITTSERASEGTGPVAVLFDRYRESLAGVLRDLRGRRVVCVGASAAPAEVWRLMHAGAREVLLGPPDQMAGRIAPVLERWRAVDELMAAPEVAGKLIGASAAWRGLLEQVVEVARFTASPVLIIGETGTGKELLAHLIHELDARERKSELITADCTVIVPELSGSELFGHERGAFTGALQQREGAFALASGGTLFLDEVGELPPALQAQLLRAVQEKMYKRVGGNTWQRTDFRLVCATNRDLGEDVARGKFRADLYFRLASWVFRPPPLRDRREDILPLARYFLAQSLAEEARPGAFDPAVEEWLAAREYPGNVRELRQLVTRLGQRHVGTGPVTAGALPREEWPGPLAAEPAAAEGGEWSGAPLEEMVRRALREGAELKQITQAATEVAIRIAVQQEDGSLQRAARKLGVTDRALQMRRANGLLA